jgi:hypothetical protein
MLLPPSGIPIILRRKTYLHIAAQGITGNKLKTNITQVITFQVGRKTFKHKFLIAPLDVEYSGILGVYVLKRMEARVDLWSSTLVLGRTSH